MQEVNSGWLTKSPRNKRGPLSIFSSWQHWRRRYFVLYALPLQKSSQQQQQLQQQQHPQQQQQQPSAYTSRLCRRRSRSPRTSAAVVFNYYEDETLRSKRGTIDMDHCNEVVDHVESCYYRHIFLLRTKHKGRRRTYYLAADTSEEVTGWVDRLRCCLNLQEDKAFSEELQRTFTEPQTIASSCLLTMAITMAQLSGVPLSGQSTSAPRDSDPGESSNVGDSSENLSVALRTHESSNVEAVGPTEVSTSNRKLLTLGVSVFCSDLFALDSSSCDAVRDVDRDADCDVELVTRNRQIQHAESADNSKYNSSGSSDSAFSSQPEQDSGRPSVTESDSTKTDSPLGVLEYESLDQSRPESDRSSSSEQHSLDEEDEDAEEAERPGIDEANEEKKFGDGSRDTVNEKFTIHPKRRPTTTVDEVTTGASSSVDRGSLYASCAANCAAVVRLTQGSKRYKRGYVPSPSLAPYAPQESNERFLIEKL